MKDLWRLISGFRSDVEQRFSAVDERFSDMDDRFSAMDDRFSAMDDRFSAMDDKFTTLFDELKGETQAIREVVDTLASQEDFAELDRKIALVANDTKATRTDVRNLKAELSRLKAAVKTAGIPV